MFVWLCHAGDSTFPGKLLLARHLMTVLRTQVWGWGCCHQLTDKEIVDYTKNTPRSSQATVSITWCHVQREWNKSWGGLSVARPRCEDVLGCSLFIPWGFSSFFSTAAHRRVQLFRVPCLVHVWPQPLSTAASKHCSELSVMLPVIGFVFNALAVSPRAAAMGRGESWSVGRRREWRSWGCKLSYHGYWFLQGEGGMLHFGCLHTLVVCIPLCSHWETPRDWIMWPCNLLVKILWILVQFVLQSLFLP